MEAMPKTTSFNSIQPRTELLHSLSSEGNVSTYQTSLPLLEVKVEILKRTRKPKWKYMKKAKEGGTSTTFVDLVTKMVDTLAGVLTAIPDFASILAATVEKKVAAPPVHVPSRKRKYVRKTSKLAITASTS